MSVKYPDSRRAQVLVTKLRKYSQDGEPLKNMSTKSKNQQSVFHQGEMCFERGIFMSSLTDTIFSEKMEVTWKT